MKRKLEEDTSSVQAEELVEESENLNVEFAQALENLAGIKFVSFIVKNPKEVCKLFKEISKIDATYSRNIQEKFSRVCTKYRALEKRDKFFRKISPDFFCCNGELFQSLLKYGMRASENNNFGSKLIKMLISIFECSVEVGTIKNPVLGIQMIVSHSQAADVFLEGHSVAKKQSKDELPAGEKYSDVKEELLKLWLTLLHSFVKISKVEGTENDKKILESSVPYLMQMYNATLNSADKTIFDIIKLYSSKKLKIVMETMPLFGPKCFETPPIGASNPLYAHSTRANSVLGLIDEAKALQTAIQYEESEVSTIDSEELYDMRFLLPLLTHALDEKNICNGALVVSNGWIYFIARALSFEDKILRSAAFLAYRRLILNFLTSRGFRLQDVKVWLHFLQSVKRGFTQMGQCKLSRLLSCWLVYTWDAIRQPSHPMYQRVTHFLLAKPIVELTIFPDFLPFFNAVDGNKESREWVMNVLTNGLKSKEDWKIAQKYPTVKFLCSSFLIEQAKTRKSILLILSRGATIPEVAQEFVDKHSLPLWISNISLNDKSLNAELEILFQNLVTHSTTNACKNNLFKYVALKRTWCYINNDVAN